MYKSLAIKLILSVLLVYAIGCGDKKDDKKTDDKKSNTDGKLVVPVIKDSVSGKEKVLFKYALNNDDKFSYRMEASTNNSENSPATQGKDEKQDNSINYYY